MRRILPALSVTGCFFGALCTGTVLGQTSLDVRTRCVRVLEQSTAAKTALDYDSLERFGRQAIAECPSSLGEWTTASMWADVALAQMERRQFSDALNTTNACLQNYYDYHHCHAQHALTLVKSGKPTEAKPVIQRALRICDIAEARTRSELADNERRTSESAEQKKAAGEKYAARLEEVAASRQLLETLLQIAAIRSRLPAGR